MGRRKQKSHVDRAKAALPFLYEFIFSSSLLLFNKAVERFLLGRMGWGRKERYPDKGVYGLLGGSRPLLACINSRFLYCPFLFNRVAPLYAFFLLSLSFYADSVYYPCIEDEGMWWDTGAGDEGEVFCAWMVFL